MIQPNDFNRRIALSKCYLILNQQANALAELQQALRDGGDKAREYIEIDSSLDAIRQMPELQEMLTPKTK